MIFYAHVSWILGRACNSSADYRESDNPKRGAWSCSRPAHNSLCLTLTASHLSYDHRNSADFARTSTR